MLGVIWTRIRNFRHRGGNHYLIFRTGLYGYSVPENVERKGFDSPKHNPEVIRCFCEYLQKQ